MTALLCRLKFRKRFYTSGSNGWHLIREKHFIERGTFFLLIFEREGKVEALVGDTKGEFLNCFRDQDYEIATLPTED